MTVFKVCTCCYRWITGEEWSKLPFIGRQEGEDGELLELRNCQCNSTLAIELTRDRCAIPSDSPRPS